MVEAHGRDDLLAAKYSVHISGCPNSCGLHHIADIGLHGAAKKVDGKAMPQYQLHLGGNARDGVVGLTGPLVPARQADEAIRLIRTALAATQQAGESVHHWAERLGKDGLNAILAPLTAEHADDEFVDWGEDHDFAGPNVGAKSECAATFASDDLLADLADDALIATDRHADVGRVDEARSWAGHAVVFAARLALSFQGQPTADDVPAAVVLSQVAALASLPSVVTAYGAYASAVGGDLAVLREKAALFIDTVRAAIETAKQPVTAAAVDAASLFGASE